MPELHEELLTPEETGLYATLRVQGKPLDKVVTALAGRLGGISRQFPSLMEPNGDILAAQILGDQPAQAEALKRVSGPLGNINNLITSWESIKAQMDAILTPEFAAAIAAAHARAMAAYPPAPEPEPEPEP